MFTLFISFFFGKHLFSLLGIGTYLEMKIKTRLKRKILCIYTKFFYNYYYYFSSVVCKRKLENKIENRTIGSIENANVKKNKSTNKIHLTDIVRHVYRVFRNLWHMAR